MDSEQNTNTARTIASSALAVMLVLTAALGGVTLSSQPASATHECNGVDMVISSIQVGLEYANPGENADGTDEIIDRCGRNHVNHVIEDMQESDAEQEAVDYYQGAAAAQESSEAFRASEQNNLQDTETKALMIGQEAYLKEYEQSQSVAAAEAAGIEAIEDYYAIKQSNQMAAASTQATDLEYIRNSSASETDINPDDVFTGYKHGFNVEDPDYQALQNASASNQTWSIAVYDEAEYRAPADLDTATVSDYAGDGPQTGSASWTYEFREINVDLVNGTQQSVVVPISGDHRGGCNCDYKMVWSPVPVTMISGVTTDFETQDTVLDGLSDVIEPSMQGVSTDGDYEVDKWTLQDGNPVIYAKGPSSSYDDTVAYNPDQYARLFLQSKLSSDRVVANLESWSDSVGPALESGEITTAEAVPALTFAEQYADKYSESNYLIYSAAMLADAGKNTPNLQNTGSMTIQYGGQQYTGYVILSDDETSSLQVGETYHTDEFDGQEYLLEADGSKFVMDGAFTVVEARNKDGDTVDSVGYKNYAYKTANSEDFQQLVSELEELRQEVENREANIGSGSDGSNDPPVDPMIIVALAALLAAIGLIANSRKNN